MQLTIRCEEYDHYCYLCPKDVIKSCMKSHDGSGDCQKSLKKKENAIENLINSNSNETVIRIQYLRGNI